MKRIVLALVLLALVASVPRAKADNSYFNNWIQQQAVAAQEQRFNRDMDRIDRDAAKALNGTPVGSRAVAGKRGNVNRMYCLADCLK